MSGTESPPNWIDPFIDAIREGAPPEARTWLDPLVDALKAMAARLPADDRWIDGWKDVSAFCHMAESTARRYEHHPTNPIPIRDFFGRKFAYESELRAFMARNTPPSLKARVLERGATAKRADLSGGERSPVTTGKKGRENRKSR